MRVCVCNDVAFNQMKDFSELENQNEKKNLIERIVVNNLLTLGFLSRFRMHCYSCILAPKGIRKMILNGIRRCAKKERCENILASFLTGIRKYITTILPNMNPQI